MKKAAYLSDIADNMSLYGGKSPLYRDFSLLCKITDNRKKFHLTNVRQNDTIVFIGNTTVSVRRTETYENSIN